MFVVGWFGDSIMTMSVVAPYSFPEDAKTEARLLAEFQGWLKCKHKVEECWIQYIGHEKGVFRIT